MQKSRNVNIKKEVQETKSKSKIKQTMKQKLLQVHLSLEKKLLLKTCITI